MADAAKDKINIGPDVIVDSSSENGLRSDKVNEEFLTSIKPSPSTKQKEKDVAK